MYNPKDSIDIAYKHIQDLRSKGHSYNGYSTYDVTKSDLTELKKVADKYGIPFEWLYNLLNYESAATFNPAIQNNIGATGLIQFLPSTANGLNTTTDALSKMTFKQQLNYVDKYLYANLKSHLTPQGKIPNNFTQGDVFMTIFYPVAIGKSDYTFPDYVTKANAGITQPKDYVERALKYAVFPLSLIPYTLSDVKKKFGEVYEFGKRNWIPIAVTVIGLGGLLYYLVSTGKLKIK